MQVESAINLISQKEFEKAHQLIQKLIMVDPHSAIQLFELCKDYESEISSEHFMFLEKKYAEALIAENEYEQLIDYLNTKKELNIAQKLMLIEALGELGNIPKANDIINKTFKILLDDKLYNYAPEILKLIRNNQLNTSQQELAIAIYLVDISHEKELSELMTKMIESYLKKPKTNLKKIEALEEILKNYEPKTYLGVKLKKKISLLGRKKSTKKEILEYYLLLNEKIDYLILIEKVEDEQVQNLLEIELVRAYGRVSLNEIPVVFKKTKKRFQNKVEVKQIKHSTRDEDKLIVEKELEQIIEPTNIELVRYKKPEKNIKINTQDIESHNIPNIITAMITMELFDSAEKLAQELEDSINKYYLLAELNFKKNTFAEAIYYINKTLNEYEIKEVESLSFLYLKALCFEQLNQKNEAKKYFREVIKIDPTYRSVEAKI